MLKILPDITFHRGRSNDFVHLNCFDPNVPSLTVFDDVIRTVMDDDTAADLFQESAHHRIIFIGENNQIIPRTYFIPSALLFSHLKRSITSSLQNCKQCITVRNKWILSWHVMMSLLRSKHTK